MQCPSCEHETDAGANGHSREGAVDRLKTNPDNLVSRQGDAMRANIERLERLERQRQAFVDAGPFQRLVVMTREADVDLIRAAYQDFEPAVLGGWSFTLLIGALFRRLFGLGRRRARAQRLHASAALGRRAS